MLNSKNAIGMLFAGSAIGLPLALSSTPAIAGEVCEINGTNAGDGSDVAPLIGGMACGGNAHSVGEDSIAIGQSVNATGSNSIVLGMGANVGGDYSIVIDTAHTGSVRSTGASGVNDIAMGDGVQMDSNHGVGIGDDIITNGSGVVALGSTIQAVNGGAVAIGSNVIADGVGTVAVGKNASATGANSVALGTGSVANQANTVSVGAAGNERRVTNVAAGVNATDAVNKGQLDAALAGISAFDSTILQGQIDGLVAGARHDRLEARRGVAAAVAMSEAPMPSVDGGISYSLHGSAYRGQYAIGASAKYRINRSAAVDFGVSYAGHSDAAYRVGVSGEF